MFIIFSICLLGNFTSSVNYILYTLPIFFYLYLIVFYMFIIQHLFLYIKNIIFAVLVSNGFLTFLASLLFSFMAVLYIGVLNFHGAKIYLFMISFINFICRKYYFMKGLLFFSNPFVFLVTLYSYGYCNFSQLALQYGVYAGV